MESQSQGKRRTAGYALLLTVLMLAAGGARADVVTAELTTSLDDLRFDELSGYDLVLLANGQPLAQVGAPALPMRQVRVALPPGERAVAARLVSARELPLPGRFDPYPAQPPVPTSNGLRPDFVAPDPAYYGAAGAYPAAAVDLIRQTDLAGQSMAIVSVRPVRYLPAEQRLVLLEQMTIAVETEPGYVCGDYLSTALGQKERQALHERIESMVVNPSAVQPVAGAVRLSRSLEPGDYDYVVITSADLAGGLQDLADWKTKKGVPATIVTTTWIYGEYPSGSNQEKIQAFIADAHAEWGATYFLLGGDVDKVPCHQYATPLDPGSVGNDTFYADYDGDWTIEVHVGRATGRYSYYMGIFTDKVLTYEKAPALTDYAMQAGLFGFDLDEETPAEECKDYVETAYFPADWEIAHVYDSQATDHKTEVLTVFESGLNLVNHIDHCDITSIGVGSVNHDAYLYEFDVEGFTNGDDLTVWYSTGCKALQYESSCIAEEFCKNPNGGTVAYIGNSQYGWYNPGFCNTLSNLYDRLFFQSLFTHNVTRVGECFSEHKNRYHPASEHERYVFTELTLLGDPEMMIWTADPETLAVTHASSISTGPTTLAVTVADGDAQPVAGARVCLMKDDEVYLVDETDAAGEVVFYPDAATEGMLDVTVTAQNFLPVERLVAVTGPSDVAEEPLAARFALAANRPNPFRVQTTIGFELPEPAVATLRVYDPSGRVVRTLLAGMEQGAGTHRLSWDGRDAAGRPVPAGVYLYRLEAGDRVATQRALVLR